MKLPSFLIISVILAILFSCSPNRKTDSQIVNVDSIDIGSPKKILTSIDTAGMGLPIFYNMYLSVEMTTLFESVGAVFNQDLLNNSEKTGDYITSSKKALNIGVYAVDLTYCKIFDQMDVAGRYFNSMQRLAEELGIPSDYFENTSKRFERNLNVKDSLISIANEVYMATDKYLKENEQYSAAAQVILGGWTEALYIALDVALTTKDIEIIERIAEQKHSISNLIEMLSDYKDDEVTSHFLKNLESLKLRFDAFEVNVDNNFDPDSVSGKKIINSYLTQIENLKNELSVIRKEIVE